MKLRWTRPALADLIEAQEYVSRENPVAAHALAKRVWDAAEYLCEYPRMGKPGQVAGTREWLVSDTPYVLIYRVNDEMIDILRVWHSSRNPRNKLP